MHLVIDADTAVYRAAFSAERTYYAVTLRDQVLLSDVSYAEAKAKADVTAGAVVYKRSEVKPLPAAIDALDNQLSWITSQVSARHNVKKRTLLLTGSSNFRDRLAALARYKFNRVETAKPRWYGLLRKYLVDELGAEIVHWYEADDKAAMLMTADPANTLIASIDKDLLQVPGRHFIPERGFMHVSERAGMLRFYAQALSGDAADGIPGCWRVGKAKAKKTILAAAEHVTDGPKLERALWQAVLSRYHESLERRDLKRGYDDAYTAAVETARLVYLLRSEPANPADPALWNPPS